MSQGIQELREFLEGIDGEFRFESMVEQSGPDGGGAIHGITNEPVDVQGFLQRCEKLPTEVLSIDREKKSFLLVHRIGEITVKGLYFVRQP